MVKAAVRTRASTNSPLKVVIMSATVDADKFGQYWGCPVLYVAGRQHAVSVRHISEESEVITSGNLVVVDDLASWLGTGAPPSPRIMVEILNESGHAASLSNYGRPSFRADAPWEAIVDAAMSIQPPM